MTADGRPLDGATAVFTGASSGIGRAAAEELGRRGARVAVVGRNADRTRAVAASIENADAFVADFASLSDVRRVADELLDRFERIDVLANNAGGLVSHREQTVDGHESTFQVNHLAPFLLTTLLLPRFRKTAAAGHSVTVVSTASVAARWGRLRLNDLDSRGRPWLGGWQAYGSAKTAVILTTRELARRTEGSGITAYAFHPGFVTTSFGAGSWMLRLGNALGFGGLGITPEAGAAPLVELASAAEPSAPSGTYFDGLVPHGRTSRAARDDSVATRLWGVSESLIQPWLSRT
ncbi:SDR family NAD(P)-dependent oxidoreductase [Agreia sp.]|uniref:SDR family NAD(P)-dependent oxidoreductase n=1 Tax=Agreia sp. TaxID=1872416 RepID=UPI0035BBA7EE